MVSADRANNAIVDSAYTPPSSYQRSDRQLVHPWYTHVEESIVTIVDLTDFSWPGSQVPPITSKNRSGEELVAIRRELNGLLENLPGPTPNPEKQFRANRMPPPRSGHVQKEDPAVGRNCL
ncbi:hypothetical protein pipiens_016459 [Culex pipiens pipiens]|uniref:Uncharacterized protein n=1 Tax=Culex pipiens pipiens TaxID=38569 RepID=A0ABD1CL74_CULPP